MRIRGRYAGENGTDRISVLNFVGGTHACETMMETDCKQDSLCAMVLKGKYLNAREFMELINKMNDSRIR